ncbi:hypothetical protein DB347_15665 [Opitutaceae bacterium EW11]|nr:hypothetical protein DB347_15665 [Opitutaceae bacterium EW11]
MALLVGAGASLRAAYDGPVPAPTDAFGGAGAYAVRTDTFPNADWPGHDITVVHPVDAPGRRPTWFFAHGFGGGDPANYSEFLQHLASHGSVAVYVPYPASEGGQPDEVYAILNRGFVAAADRFSDLIDTSRVGFAGHSYGGGAVPGLALRAVRERGWGANGLALFILAPWYSFSLTDADLASFPANTQAVVEVYEDDTMNDHRMAIDLFTHFNIPAENKDFLMLRSDRIDGYNYAANHRVPTGAARPGSASAFNALDAWGVLRIAQALTASAFQGDAGGRSVALGHGSPEQVSMGVSPGGRALRPMTESSHPVPLYPMDRYNFGFDRPANPRVNAALPASDNRPRLINLSARARSEPGDGVLIVGALIAGSRPKSILVRAAGPALKTYGVGGSMTDPQLALFRGTALDLTVDDWSQSPDTEVLAAATHDAHAFPFPDGSKDAAVLASFVPGALTAHAQVASGLPGVALLEFYDTEVDGTACLSNLSARASVGTGDDVLIAGFITAGGGAMRILVRAIGPGLKPFGVGGVLDDPQLEIYRGSERIAVNDNWSSDPAGAASVLDATASVGAFALPAGSADSALVLSLPAGAYTAQVRGRDGTTGVALVEVYALPQ